MTGHTLIHVATAITTPAARGFRSMVATAIRARATVTTSILPSAIGPNRARKPSHATPAIGLMRETDHHATALMSTHRENHNDRPYAPIVMGISARNG